MNLDYMEQRRNEHIFIIAFCLFILKNLLPVSDLIPYSDQLDLIVILLFFLCIGYKLISQNYTLPSFLLLIFFTLLFAYSALQTHYYSIFYGFLCVVTMQNVQLEKVLRASVIIKSVFLGIHVFIYFSVFFLYPDTVALIERNGVERHFFYLQHPNLFTAILVWTCLEVIYLMYDRIKFNSFLIIFLINVFFYLFTDTNTGMTIVLLTIALILLERHKKKSIEPLLRWGTRYLFPVLAGFFIGLVIFYTRLSGSIYSLWHELNDALTGRLLYGAFAFDQYGFTLLGRNIAYPDKSFWFGFWLDSIYFDNSYLYLFFTYGSIYLFIISIIFFLLEKKMEPKEKIFVITLAVFGVMEGYMLNISLCFPMIVIGKYIYDYQFNYFRRGTISYGD